MWDLLNINNDQNLRQGQLMLDRRKKLLTVGKPDMDLLEQTTGPNLGSCSLIEGFTQKTSPDASITALENEFNTTLVEYTTSYRLLMGELVSNNNSPALKNYAGKNVKLNEDIYYVNNYGVAHLYDEASWKGKSSSCSNDYVDITANELDLLMKGNNMNLGQSCDVAGYNIENKTTSERSWVDIKGVKHIYPDDVWTNRSESCQGVPRSVKNSAYLAIPSDSSSPPITKDFYCNKLNVDPELLQNLAKSNERLLSLGRELLKDTETLSVTDIALNTRLNKLSKTISANISNLEKDKQVFDNTLKTVGGGGILSGEAYNSNVRGIKQSSQYKLSSNYVQYLFWLITALVLILYTFYSFNSTSSSAISTIIILLVAVVLLYKLATYFHYKLF